MENRPFTQAKYVPLNALSNLGLSDVRGVKDEQFRRYINNVYSNIKFKGIIVENLNYYPYTTRWSTPGMAKNERPRYDPDIECTASICKVDREYSDDIEYILEGEEPKIPDCLSFILSVDKIIFCNMNDTPIKHYGSDHIAYYLDYHTKYTVKRRPQLEPIESYDRNSSSDKLSREYPTLGTSRGDDSDENLNPEYQNITSFDENPFIGDTELSDDNEFPLINKGDIYDALYRIKAYKIYPDVEYVSGVWWTYDGKILKVKLLYQEC